MVSIARIFVQQQVSHVHQISFNATSVGSAFQHHGDVTGVTTAQEVTNRMRQTVKLSVAPSHNSDVIMVSVSQRAGSVTVSKTVEMVQMKMDAVSKMATILLFWVNFSLKSLLSDFTYAQSIPDKL